MKKQAVCSVALSHPDTFFPLLEQALHLEQHFPQQQANYRQRYVGKEVVSFFLEASTRTRSSFELACHRWGATVLSFNAEHSSLSKGETIDDTLETFLAMGVDAVVLRQGQDKLPHRLADTYGHELHLINAGDGKNDHPTQGLLDCMTLVQCVNHQWEALRNERFVIVGDVLHSRVVGSLLPYLHTLGMEVIITAPPYFMPTAEHQAYLSRTYGVCFEPELTTALQGARFVYGLRIQHERLVQRISLEDYTQAYQLTPALLQRLAHPVVRFLHPGPVNRGVEATSALVDDTTLSLVRQQVHNGVFARMAVLDWCFNP